MSPARVKVKGIVFKVGDQVRWQPGPHCRFRFYTVKGINADGSLDLRGRDGARALMPGRVERKDKGPRGGTVWVKGT